MYLGIVALVVVVVVVQCYFSLLSKQARREAEALHWILSRSRIVRSLVCTTVRRIVTYGLIYFYRAGERVGSG